MDYTFTKVIYSPGGTCSKTADLIAGPLNQEAKTINLLTDKIEDDLSFTEKDVLIFALPVFISRIPLKTVDMLKKLKGNNTYAIPTVVYGNLVYGDALLELVEILQSNGFIVASAASIVAKHSMFPRVATSRPDKSDVDKITEFANKSLELIQKATKGQITVPGTNPYKPLPPKGLPIDLKVSSACNDCKACAKICPEGAIPMENPRTTDKTKCNNCTACIHICPQKARNFGGLGYAIISKIFGFMCRKRREPEFFYVQ